MTSTSLLIQLMWFAIGFGTGAVVAAAARWGNSHLNGTTRMSGRLASNPRARTALGAGIFVAVLASLLLSYFQRIELASTTACQAHYNSDVATIITERARLNTADREATINLIIGVFTPPKGLTQQQEAQRDRNLFLNWKKAEDNYRTRLAADRFPSLENRCG